MSTITTAPAVPRTDRSVHRFQTRVGICASGGKFCDGWILGVIGSALPLAAVDLGFGAMWSGLLGAASLIGLFIGGLLFGRITDVVGRKRMFLATLLTFLIGSVLQFVVTGVIQLFALRLLMGVAIGADYAIAGALVAEFMPRRRRGPGLARMLVWWYLGFSLAAILGVLVTWNAPDWESSWRWILASSTIPALIMLLTRIGIPESPRWLASKGRDDEAEVIAQRYLEAEEFHPDAERATGSRFADLFSSAHWRKTLFTSLFWMAQVTPFFAIYTFLPSVLASLDISDAGIGEIALNLFLFLGSALGALLVNRLGRRPLLITGFVGSAVMMLILGVWPTASGSVVLLCFLVYALFNAGHSVLQILYPSEVFPTEIRSTGIGFAAAMSRIGAAVGTFLLPLGLEAWGVGTTMLLGFGVLVLGLVVSLVWAPETKNLDLNQASRTVGE